MAEAKKKTTKKEKPLTKDEKIMADFQRGVAIVNIARIHDVEIDHVYMVIGQPEMMKVHIIGDLIDDAGPGAVINGPTTAKVHYTKN